MHADPFSALYLHHNRLFSCCTLKVTFYQGEKYDNYVNEPQIMVDILVQKISPIKIFNVKFTGDPRCAGNYSGGRTVVPEKLIHGTDVTFPDSGIFMSTGTGSASDLVAAAPRNGNGTIVPGFYNNATSTTTQSQFFNATDPDLSRIAGSTVTDACVLEFDFQANCSFFIFDYSFASDEYNEYVFTAYHDIFGFFLNGSNIATVPNTNLVTPVDVNTINNQNNSDYYINNVDGLNFPYFQADGFTTGLTASSEITPEAVYHFKIGIANTGDSLIDSWVFLKQEGFRCGISTPPTPQSTCTLPQSTIPHATPACTKDIKTNEVIGVSGINKPPFTIVARNTTTVTFTVQKEWASNGSVYVQYFDMVQEQYECIGLCSKPDNFTITAHCLRTVPIAIIEIWVETDVVGDNANISTCCSAISGDGRHYPDNSLSTKHYIEGTYELWCDCHGTAVENSQNLGSSVRKLRTSTK